MQIQSFLISVFIVAVLLGGDLYQLRRKKIFEWKGVWFALASYAFGLTVFTLSSFCIRQGFLFPMLMAAAESIKKLIGG